MTPRCSYVSEAHIHAQLDDLERHAAAHRIFLFGHVNNTATALPDLLEQFVTPNPVA